LVKNTISLVPPPEKFGFKRVAALDGTVRKIRSLDTLLAEKGKSILAERGEMFKLEER
jgi:hypothetical protein